MELLYKQECYDVIGACFEVYNEHSSGFSEDIYHESLAIEFRLRKLAAVSKPKLELRYKGELLRKDWEPDFVCFGKIIVELKAVKALNDAHRSQVLKYLKASGFRLGLLVNFGQESELQWERIIL